MSIIGADRSFRNVSAQHPIATSGDSVYASDIDVANSDNGNFSGSITDYFDSLKTVNEDVTANNPKQIVVRFTRSLQTASIGFGCDDPTKDFSNIKIEIIGSADEVRSIVDESTDNTKYNSRLIAFPPEAANGVIISFFTSDPVGLSNLIIYKTVNVASRIQAIKPNNLLTDIGATNNDNLRVSINEYGDTPAVDAFARLRVSENFTIFDSKQLHDKQPLFWDEELGGSATSVHNTVDADVEMTVTANASDYVVRQTKQHFNYQPGKSQLIFMTFRSPQVSGVTTRVGYCSSNTTTPTDIDNGIYFECDGILSWNIVKNGTLTESIPQSSWNVDPLDGTGASGITLDMSACQILILDFEWLGVGRVRAGFVIDGLIYYVHYFNHSNDPTFDSVYMSTPNLPLRYSVETDGTNGTTVGHICSSVISEGGIEKTGVLRSAESANVFTTGFNVVGTKYALCGIRLKTAYRDMSIIPEEVQVIIGTNDSFKWELHLNPTINGVWSYADLANSSVQVAQTVGATNTVPTDGVIVGRGGGSTQTRSNATELQTALRIGSTIAGVQDELVLVITPLSATLSAWGCINFRELI